METVYHNDFTFKKVREDAVNVIIHLTGYATDEFIKVKRSMYDGLQMWVDDNY